MKRALLIIAVILMGLSACRSDKKEEALLSRKFPTSNWERFDFIVNDIQIAKPTTYDLVLEVYFAPSYAYNYLSVVFTIFDDHGNPFRSKDYKFNLKEKDGSWKSTLTEQGYHFSFPINSELNINEPGLYKFQLENHMPITPLEGINEIKIIKQRTI